MTRTRRPRAYFLRRDGLAYTGDGALIGSHSQARTLCGQYRIRPERIAPADTVARIGWSERFRRYYGWRLPDATTVFLCGYDPAAVGRETARQMAAEYALGLRGAPELRLTFAEPESATNYCTTKND